MNLRSAGKKERRFWTDDIEIDFFGIETEPIPKKKTPKAKSKYTPSKDESHEDSVVVDGFEINSFESNPYEITFETSKKRNKVQEDSFGALMELAKDSVELLKQTKKIPAHSKESRKHRKAVRPLGYLEDDLIETEEVFFLASDEEDAINALSETSKFLMNMEEKEPPLEIRSKTKTRPPKKKTGEGKKAASKEETENVSVSTVVSSHPQKQQKEERPQASPLASFPVIESSFNALPNLRKTAPRTATKFRNCSRHIAVAYHIFRQQRYKTLQKSPNPELPSTWVQALMDPTSAAQSLKKEQMHGKGHGKKKSSAYVKAQQQQQQQAGRMAMATYALNGYPFPYANPLTGHPHMYQNNGTIGISPLYQAMVPPSFLPHPSMMYSTQAMLSPPQAMLNPPQVMLNPPQAMLNPPHAMLNPHQSPHHNPLPPPPPHSSHSAPHLQSSIHNPPQSVHNPPGPPPPPQSLHSSHQAPRMRQFQLHPPTKQIVPGGHPFTFQLPALSPSQSFSSPSSASSQSLPSSTAISSISSQQSTIPIIASSVATTNLTSTPTTPSQSTTTTTLASASSPSSQSAHSLPHSSSLPVSSPLAGLSLPPLSAPTVLSPPAPPPMIEPARTTATPKQPSQLDPPLPPIDPAASQNITNSSPIQS